MHAKAVFDLLLSKADADTIEQANNNGLTPMHVAAKYSFKHARGILEARVSENARPKIVINNEILSYKDFKKRIVKVEPVEPEYKTNNSPELNYILASYKTLYTEQTPAELEKNLDEAEGLIKDYISNSNALADEYAAQQALVTIKNMPKGPEKVQRFFKVQQRIKDLAQDVKSAKSAKSAIEMLMKFCMCHENPTDLIEFLETKLNECGLFNELASIYHHVFLASKELKQNEQATSFLVKAQEIIEKHSEQVLVKEKYTNFYYRAFDTKDAEQKFTLLKAAYNLYEDKQADILYHLSGLSLKYDRDNTHKYVLEYWSNLCKNNSIEKDEVGKIKHLNEALRIDGIYKTFSPSMIHIMFLLESRINPDSEFSGELYHMMNPNLNHMIIKASNSEDQSLVLFYKFMQDLSTRIQVNTAIQKGDYAKAKSYAEYIQNNEQRASFVELLNKMMNSQEEQAVDASTLPDNINFLVYRIDSGVIKISEIPTKLAALYFQYYAINDSNISPTISVSELLTWDKNVEVGKVEYTYGTIYDNLFAYDKDGFFIFIDINLALTPALQDIKKKIVGGVKFQSNGFYFNIPESDDVIYGNQIIVNPKGLRLLFFNGSCVQKEREAVFEDLDLILTFKRLGTFSSRNDEHKPNDDSEAQCTNNIDLQLLYKSIFETYEPENSMEVAGDVNDMFSHETTKT